MERLFSLFLVPESLLAPSKKRLFSPLQFGKEENTHWHSSESEKGAYLFIFNVVGYPLLPQTE